MNIDHLRSLFEQHGIRSVAIIDDAYLEHPTLADLKLIDGVKELWAAVDASDEVPEFLLTEGISLTTLEDIDESQLTRLYELRQSNAALSAILNQFDDIQAGKREQMMALKALLEELSLAPLELPPSASLVYDPLPDLIFLDYYLDPAGLESSLPLAKTVGENIRNAFAQHQKPFVVLMSNVGTIKPENRSLFRDTAEIIGGLFHFIPKAELRERNLMILSLALMVRSIEEGRKIQQFVERYDGAIHTLATEFQKKIRGLSLEDYAYIQKLSLQGEGQPLGDYVLWLFGMYFSHLLGRENPDGRKILDAMVFSHIPDALDPPSPDFVGLYQNVVSESVDALGTHPRLSASERARLGDNAPPDPHFGDLFFRDDGAVVVVATPECDLAYAPEENSARPFSPERPVLLIPGQLQRYSVQASSGGTTTDYVEADGKNQRVVWRLKWFSAVPAGALRRKLAEDRFVRRRRLRMPFSHCVQQALTTDIARIGTPVAPPIIRPAGFDMYYRVVEGRYRKVSGVQDSATISFTLRHDDEEIQFRLSAVVAIVKECPQAIAELEKLRESESDERRRPAFERDILALRSFVVNAESQLALAESFSMKVTGEHKVRDAPIKVRRKIDEGQLQNWHFNVPMVIVIVEEAGSEAQ